jgi:serine/threonine-protein kinase HipA
MVDRIDTAVVRLWGEDIGAVAWLDDTGYAVFEYEPAFIEKGLDISPIRMDLDSATQGDGLFSFPDLNKDTFLGLPGMLADALPDKFGNAIIDAWLISEGRDVGDFSPVGRLCYMGKRGMGALEFHPCSLEGYDTAVTIDVGELVKLTQEIMGEYSAASVSIGEAEKDNTEAITELLRVATSAGGARAKAIIAMNDDGEIVSGQAEAPGGYDCWILKFDGVTDLELGESAGYGRIEYAYHLMATTAGIDMMPCRLLEEKGRAHFMTRRFDRVGGEKRHVQTLCGLAHYDFNMVGAYSYEQAFSVMRRLRLSKADATQMYRRMLFNVIARNQDDHTRNIAFIMDPHGKWALSPAYDVIYSHNPAGQWTNRHQMSLNGKRDEFTRDDLLQVGESISLARPADLHEEVREVVSRWPEFAAEAGIEQDVTTEIGRQHRLFR